jgi:glycosyltransferase involved in cell wall biosynthesis
MARIWSINGRFATHALTGVQRYAHEIVRKLDELVCERHPLTADAELELLLPPGAPPLSGLRAIRQRHVGRVGGQLWEQVSLPAHIRGGLLSLCNVGPLAVARQIICMHDLNTRICPQSYALRFRALYRVLLPVLGGRAQTVATVSDYSAGQLSGFRVAPRSKIVVIPNGHEHVLGWQPAQEGCAGDGDTIVLLGSAAPHKNVRRILDLAPQLAALGLSVAVAGACDPRVFAGSGALSEAPNVRWLGRLTDDALAGLLQRSLCLAFPSLTEGFGLPPLEAMALGCPVVVSDRASLPEVCADAALYADPDDGQAWLDALTRLRSEPGLRARLSAAGRLRARHFRWRHSAELYLEAMARIDGFVPKGCEAHGAGPRGSIVALGEPARGDEPATVAGRHRRHQA